MKAQVDSQHHGIILSVSSDIGIALARDWLERGFAVSGTFRTRTPELAELERDGLRSVALDLADKAAISFAAGELSQNPWTRVVLAAGSQEPVGLFEDVDQYEWGRSIETNFIAQFQFLGRLLAFRSRTVSGGARVLSFAGGATNRATTHYSAYTVSKIASIKMTELLAEEMPDVGFTSLGPGWVRTKIHDATLNAGSRAGDNFLTTVRHHDEDDFFPMAGVIDAINWIMESPLPAVTGRNFSAVHDPFTDKRLVRALLTDPDMFKLRRSGNDRFC